MEDNKPNLNRRSFLKTGVGASAGIYLGANGFFSTPANAAFGRLEAEASSPMADVTGEYSNPNFTGDEMTRPHDSFWDLPGYIKRKGGYPAQATELDIAIVGGGMSGLLTAYMLRDKKPLLLELNARFGGNSRGEKYKGVAYTIGAAYITIPDPGTSIEKFLKELNLNPRHEEPDDARVHLSGKGLFNLWKSDADPKLRASAEAVEKEFNRIVEHSFPSIPFDEKSGMSRDELNRMDSMTADAWLREKFPDLHPALGEYFQLYGWSSFGASLQELSAAQFINFVSTETMGVLAFPGGNSTITKALHGALMKANPAGMQSGCIVLELRRSGDRVEVLYEDAGGTLRLLRARKAIVCTPKYVAKRIIRDVPAEQLAAWNGIEYRAYVVANVLMSTKRKSAAFDVYCLEGKIPPPSSFGRRTDRPITDMISADWANQDRGQVSIQTIFRPYPFDGARSLLTSGEIAYNRIKSDVEQALAKKLADFGHPPDGIAGYRITHWGHAIPVAKPGGVSNGTIDVIRRPIDGKIFFANQDNILNPAFETCFAMAEEANDEVRKLL